MAWGPVNPIVPSQHKCEGRDAACPRHWADSPQGPSSPKLPASPDTARTLTPAGPGTPAPISWPCSHPPSYPHARGVQSRQGTGLPTGTPPAWP